MMVHKEVILKKVEELEKQLPEEIPPEEQEEKAEGDQRSSILMNI